MIHYGHIGLSHLSTFTKILCMFPNSSLTKISYHMIKHTVTVACKANLCTIYAYRIAQNGGGGKLWRIDHFRVCRGKRWQI